MNQSHIFPTASCPIFIRGNIRLRTSNHFQVICAGRKTRGVCLSSFAKTLNSIWPRNLAESDARNNSEHFHN